MHRRRRRSAKTDRSAKLYYIPTVFDPFLVYYIWSIDTLRRVCYVYTPLHRVR